MELIYALLNNMRIVLASITEYFKESLISTVFFVFIFLVFILNIVKRVFIWQEKKRGILNQSCEFLIMENNEQDCNLMSRRKYFKSNGNSCEGCRGKSFKMTDSEAENRIAKGTIWKHIIILLANYSKNALPYVSFIYTLAVTIFEIGE